MKILHRCYKQKIEEVCYTNDVKNANGIWKYNGVIQYISGR